MTTSDLSSSESGLSYVVTEDNESPSIAHSNETEEGSDHAGNNDSGDDSPGGSNGKINRSVAVAAISAVGLCAWMYERSLQKSLTKPPLVFGQVSRDPQQTNGCRRMAEIHRRMLPLLDRPIVPSLVIGTRGLASSVAAYFQAGPGRRLEDHPDQHHFRQYLTMAADGATIAIDWELPVESHRNEHHNSDLPYDTKESILNGPISRPTVLIWHGINNDASFGYIRSLKRSFCDRGWNAAAVNFRGCGGVPLTTPRGYTAGYTGDLRHVVWHVSAKMMEGGQRPTKTLFLVGNSLGANLVAKYLGEEGHAGTLPPCVGGGVALGNPLHIQSSNISWPVGVAMGLGVKRTLMQNWNVFKSMSDSQFRSEFRKVMFHTQTVAEMDQIISQLMIRNDPVPPYQPQIGYHGNNRRSKKSQKNPGLTSGEMYWQDSSSYIHVKNISVPFLHVIASDDFLVIRPSRNKLSYLLSANPNVMVVETACGGHLGWHEEGDGSVLGSSWADGAAADFFAAVMDTKSQDDFISISVGTSPLSRL